MNTNTCSPLEINDKQSFGIAGFVDVETTGLNPSYDEIIELSICLFEFNRENGQITKIVDKYVGLREPGVAISQSAQRVNNISYKDVKGKSLDIDRVEALIDKAEFLVAHNASFDKGFMNRMFSNCISKKWFCSIKHIDWKSKGFRARSLAKLLAEHGIIQERAHRAEDDVLAAIELISWEKEDGTTYFYEILQEMF